MRVAGKYMEIEDLLAGKYVEIEDLLNVTEKCW
jgi:hypothetical protein